MIVQQILTRAKTLTKSITNRDLDATELLARDHMQVDVLFVRIKMAKKRSQKRPLFERIRDLLELHALAEEKVFYPACEQFPELQPQITEANEEHSEVKHLLKTIHTAFEKGGKVNSKITRLIAAVQHHVREEEGELFPVVRKLLSEDDLLALGARITETKKELMKSRGAEEAA